MEITRATQSNIEQIMRVIEECKRDMKLKGVEQWPASFPKRESFVAAADNGELFAAKEGGNVVACVILNHDDDGADYSRIKWQIEDSNPLFVHRLAVLPSLQGKGIAKKMMDFAEEHAKAEGSKCVRLDTYSKNIISNKFYEKIGYKRTGSINLYSLMPEEYFCYEKVIGE